MLRLNPEKVFDAFWATALEDAQLNENDWACAEDRDPHDFYGDPTPEHAEAYRSAIRIICEKVAPLIASQNPNTFPKRCPDGDLNGIFGSDLYLTAAGHGAGLWDGDWDPIGDELTEIAKDAPSGDLAEHIDGGYFFV